MHQQPMHSAIFLFAFICGVSFCPLRAEGLQSVAVVDFEGRGIPVHEAAIISERFRSSLVKSGLVKVMERGQMENILKEQGFQQSGACTEASCVVQMGQLLAVEKVIVGSVGKIGAMYTLNVRLVDVATGEILLSHDQDVKGSVEDVMLQAVPQMSDLIIKETTSMKVQVGYLNVVSSPAGAAVTAADKKIGTTPVKQAEVPAGQLIISIALENYAPQERTITLAKGSTQDLSFTLSPTGEYLDMQKKARQSQRRNLRLALRLGSGAVALAGVGLAGFYHLEWTKKDPAYHETLDPAEARSLHESIVDIQNIRTACLIIGAAGAMGLGVSFAF